MSQVPRDIDTEPDDAFEAVFGDLGERPVLPRSGDDLPAPSAPKVPDEGEGRKDQPAPGRTPEAAGLNPGTMELNLEAMDLPDEIDPSLWEKADPEHGGVDEDKALYATGKPLPDDTPGRDLEAMDLNLEAMDLPDEIDPSLWEKADPEHGGVDEDKTSGDDSIPVLAPGRDLDAEAARELQDGLLELAALDCGRIRLDLTGVSRIEAPGLAVMAAGAEDLAGRGGGLEISGARGPVAELLKTLKFQHGFAAGTQE